MMTNLFSTFDPSSSVFNLPLNWISSLLFLVFIPLLYWIIPSRPQMLWFSIINVLHNEFKVLIKSSSQYESTMVFISLFSFVLINNFLGLFPYIFTSTSHLILTLTISLIKLITKGDQN